MNFTRESLGIFWWDAAAPLGKKKMCRLARISTYFTEERLSDVLLPIINKSSPLSLRALDWLVTNYAKKFPVVYTVTPANCPPVVINVYRSYKSWLWNHKRKSFDPFRRGQRVFFNVGGKAYESTVGQLNFFYWAARYGVLDFARANIDAIEKDQASTVKHVTHGETAGEADESCPKLKRKRRQLSQAPRKSVFVYPAAVRVVFNP